MPSEPVDGLSEEQQTRRDTAYSPSSEDETESLQRHDVDETPAEHVDGEQATEQVTVLPGTGGPDDAGDIDDPDNASIPERVRRAEERAPQPGAPTSRSGRPPR